MLFNYVARAFEASTILFRSKNFPFSLFIDYNTPLHPQYVNSFTLLVLRFTHGGIETTGVDTDVHLQSLSHTSLSLHQTNSFKNQILPWKQYNLHCQNEHLDFISSWVIEEIKFMTSSARAIVIGRLGSISIRVKFKAFFPITNKSDIFRHFKFGIR